MRALVCRRYGTPEDLELAELPDPAGPRAPRQRRTARPVRRRPPPTAHRRAVPAGRSGGRTQVLSRPPRPRQGRHRRVLTGAYLATLVAFWPAPPHLITAAGSTLMRARAR